MNYYFHNELSKLHDGKNIIFCKTDYLRSELEEIRKIDNEVILISGNSDYGIDDNYLTNLPTNIKKWFAQNALSNNEIIEPLPLGLTNVKESLRSGHGYGWGEEYQKRVDVLRSKKNIKTTNFIYANFNCNTNHIRYHYKDYSVKLNHITWEDSNLSMSDFYDKILNHQMCLCPVGNGVDTHRLWEVLYLNRTPVTVKTGNYKLYELYNKLPIIVLDSIEQLEDIEFLNNHYNAAQEKWKNINLINVDFWIEKISKKDFK